MPKEQQTFTKEFKLEAVRLVRGRSATFKKSSSHLLTGCQMKYRFMREHQQEYPVTTMCQVLNASVSGYSAWKRRPVSARQIADEQLSARIRQVHEATHPIYGSRRIRAELAEQGSSCRRKRVVRLMRQHRLKARWRRHRTVTTDSQYTSGSYQALLAQWGIQVSMSGKGDGYDNAAMESFFSSRVRRVDGLASLSDSKGGRSCRSLSTSRYSTIDSCAIPRWAISVQ